MNTIALDVQSSICSQVLKVTLLSLTDLEEVSPNQANHHERGPWQQTQETGNILQGFLHTRAILDSASGRRAVG